MYKYKAIHFMFGASKLNKCKSSNIYIIYMSWSKVQNSGSRRRIYKCYEDDFWFEKMASFDFCLNVFNFTEIMES